MQGQLSGLFTFHYGSILIFSIVFLWNFLSEFTFHYGSILMPLSNIACAITTEFTFHYGSILIIALDELACLMNSIYIPLWFYSNYFYSMPATSSIEFTFHYGSILIVISNILMYYHIDLHSTMVLF